MDLINFIFDHALLVAMTVGFCTIGFGVMFDPSWHDLADHLVNAFKRVR